MLLASELLMSGDEYVALREGIEEINLRGATGESCERDKPL